MADGPPLHRLVRDPQIVFDTMVPVAWAVAGHGGVLRYAFRNRAIIPGRVYREIDGHSHSVERARAGEMLRPTCFARTVEIAPADRAKVVQRMEGWSSIEAVANDPNGNRGESEAIQLCLNLGKVPLITQDHQGYRTAGAEGINAYSSVHLLYALVIQGLVADCARAWGMYAALEPAGLWPVPDYPYDAAGQRRFLGQAAEIEAIGMAWRARRP